ncbi:MAG: hypothetical protein M3680_14580 [Myxococcota bacterium]|nr:hypothetical protein [Myxococcota bacterium]
MPARDAADAIVLVDPETGFGITALELFAERDALAVLVTALIAEVPGTADRGAFKTAIAARLREVAELHGADADDLAAAELYLSSAFQLLDADDDHDETPQEIP